MIRKIYIFILIFFTLVSVSHADITNYTDGNSILSLTVHENTLWPGTNGGLVQWDLSDFSHKKIGTHGKLPHMKVTGVAFDKKGNTWIGTHAGVVRYDKKKWRFYGIKNGLPIAWINHIYIDNADTPWVSTKNGIGWFNGYYWESKKNDQVTIKQVYSMVQDQHLDFWFAAKGDGLIHNKGDLWEAYKRIHTYPQQICTISHC